MNKSALVFGLLAAGAAGAMTYWTTGLHSAGLAVALGLTAIGSWLDGVAEAIVKHE